jgi:hypothetical protein
MNLTEQITNLRSSLEHLYLKYSSELITLHASCIKLNELLVDFWTNWHGAWASPNFDVYINFITKEGYIKPTDLHILDYIESIAQIKFQPLKEKAFSVLKEFDTYKEDFITELSIIKGIDTLGNEIELLNRLEQLKWGFLPKDYIEIKRPKQFYIQDPSILNKGLDVPPHIQVEANIFYVISTLTSIETFYKEAKRLLRQIELRTDKKYSARNPESSEEFIFQIINNFHLVVNQLKNRHEKRETLVVKDEYDVQDLFHSLLKIKFNNIKEEEYTPSFAGSSTRIDFLLKTEKIAIEIKKTRIGLKDKQIGEQLILDVQHYKTHPDCNQLIFFIYDPEGLVLNPRGLEIEINNLSGDDLKVDTFIRP